MIRSCMNYIEVVYFHTSFDKTASRSAIAFSMIFNCGPTIREWGCIPGGNRAKSLLLLMTYIRSKRTPVSKGELTLTLFEHL